MDPQQTNPTSHQFEIDGDELCLDFANTVDLHLASIPDEHLNSYSDLAAWGYQAGLYGEQQHQSLLELAAQQPSTTEDFFNRALELREAIYRIFSAAALLQPVQPKDLDILNRYLSPALAHARIQQGDQGDFVWGWHDNTAALDRILWPVARSAAELLTNPERLVRIGRCQDDRGCGWLFIDTSKNHSRRWCSMESCGNRAKALRHYGRSKTNKTKSD
jgi:predicted RNA-binding Zn ribbon-like protein